MLLCLVWEALIWPVASGQVRWHRLLFWERVAPSLSFLCHFQVRPLGHFPLQILPVYFMVGWWKVMTERLMVVLAVPACDHVISAQWQGLLWPASARGAQRNRQIPTPGPEGQCEVAPALTDRTLGFVREICPCCRSPVGPIVALVSICTPRTSPV